MKINKVISKVNPTLAPALILYSVLGIFLGQFYRYQLNGDGISYISIARKYLDGNLADAVNAYWSPLFSWLLVPFLFLGILPQVAAKAITLAAGFATIIGIKTFSNRFEITENMKSVLLLSVIPLVLYCALSMITPDLVFLCLLIFYFAALIAEKVNQSDSAIDER